MPNKILSRLTAILLSAAMVIPSVASAAFIPADSLPTFIQTGTSHSSRLIIELKNQRDLPAVDRLIHTYDAQILQQLGQSNFFVVERATEQLETALRSDNHIVHVERDRKLTSTQTPNDPYFARQWYLSAINAPAAWDITHGSSNLTVAVLDTGVDATHPDLAGHILPGFNTEAGGTDTTDTIGHGTWVAGTIAASINNSAGVAGIASGVNILPIKVTDTEGTGYTSSVVAGLLKASEQGARIANVSFEIHEGDAAITAAAKQFVAHGGLVFAAAGNDHTLHSGGPNPYIISVGSVGPTNGPSLFSSFGTYVDLAAPGEGITTTGIGGSYSRVSGTSFASPIAAASAALVWGANPSLSNEDVELILRTTARDVGPAGPDSYTGSGLVNVGAAVALAQSKSSPVVPVVTTAPPVLPSVPTYNQPSAPPVLPSVPAQAPMVVAPPVLPTQPVVPKVVAKKPVYKYKYVRVRTVVNKKVRYVWRRVLVRVA